MSTVSSDYNNYTSGSAACNYAPLGQYSGDYSMGVPFQGKVTSGAYIVPTWSPIGYDALTAKVPSCVGYSDINTAYGANAGNCQTTYRTSLCGGNQMGSSCATVTPDKRSECCAEKVKNNTFSSDPYCQQLGSSCDSFPPGKRTACCASKQINKICDLGCANAKQFCK